MHDNRLPSGAPEPLDLGLRRLSELGQSHSRPPSAGAVMARGRHRRHRRRVAGAIAVPLVIAAVAVGVISVRSTPGRTTVAVGSPTVTTLPPGSATSAPLGGSGGTSSAIPTPVMKLAPVSPGGAPVCSVVSNPLTSPSTQSQRGGLRANPVAIGAVWVPSGIEGAECTGTVTTLGPGVADQLLREVETAVAVPAAACAQRARGEVDLVFEYASAPRLAVVSIPLAACGRITLPDGRQRLSGGITTSLSTFAPPAWFHAVDGTPAR